MQNPEWKVDLAKTFINIFLFILLKFTKAKHKFNFIHFDTQTIAHQCKII
jgi:hypothetical protein